MRLHPESARMCERREISPTIEMILDETEETGSRSIGRDTELLSSLERADSTEASSAEKH